MQKKEMMQQNVLFWNRTQGLSNCVLGTTCSKMKQYQSLCTVNELAILNLLVSYVLQPNMQELRMSATMFYAQQHSN